MSSIGTDIEKISRIEKVLARTPKFAEKVFTALERKYCNGRGRPAQHYAARFCAKEAFAKALSVPTAWQEIEVINNRLGAPVLRITGETAELLNKRNIQLSLSHAGDYAIAVVLVED